jgi:hypothetical protein
VCFLGEFLLLLFLKLPARHFGKLTAEIKTASDQGKIAQFFNSNDNASAITKYLSEFDSIIGRLNVCIDNFGHAPL